MRDLLQPFKDLIYGKPPRNFSEPNKDFITIKILYPLDSCPQFGRGQIITVDSLEARGKFVTVVTINRVAYVAMNDEFVILL